jgi:hypothetical protein
MFEAAEGGLMGAVTDRFMPMPDGKGDGVGDGVSEDIRRGRIVDESPCCAWGRTGNGRRKGFGEAEVRRRVLLSPAVEAYIGAGPIIDWR